MSADMRCTQSESVDGSVTPGIINVDRFVYISGVHRVFSKLRLMPGYCKNTSA